MNDATTCQCPVAGYCDRHQVNKTEHWHKLCQTKPAYFEAWEKGTGPGQAIPDLPPDSPREQRRQRVNEAVARSKRLVGWLQFFQIEGDRGIGDTAHRLNLQSCRHPAIHKQLDQLLNICSCTRQDAVERLNKKWPRD